MRSILFYCLAFLFAFDLFAVKHKDLLSLGDGIQDLWRPEYRTVEFRAEYKFYEQWDVFRPLLGLMTTGKGALYAYGGVGFELIFYDRFIFSPNIAAGYYHQGGGKNLGFPLEFRSGIEIGWQFKNFYRLGIHFYHISNASLGNKNPGTESLVLFYSIPITRR